ncbi:AAA family ATPase [Deinococcus sp. UYEF24]
MIRTRRKQALITNAHQYLRSVTFQKHNCELEEIKLDISCWAVLSLRGQEIFLPNILTFNDITHITTAFNGFRDDNRTGLDRTLHRISKLPGARDSTGGITIRLARHIVGAADVLLPHIKHHRSILLIGVPGVGKTTLLREVIRHLALRYSTKVMVVDTSAEVTGAGQAGHWAAMPARRILVTNKSQQPELIRQAYANDNPMIIAVDEIGHHGDADAIASTIDRGVGMIATCHGETITNVVNTQTFWPVMGAIREHGYERQRMTKASFDVAVEVRGVGRFIVQDDVTAAVDQVLAGEVPRGKRVGNWPNLRTG